MDGRQLKEVLSEALAENDFSVKKLVEASSVAERYIHLLLEGELRKLPPAPYVRGYLTKVALVLDLDKEDLFERYHNEIEGLTSGPNDKLPTNRFAIHSYGGKLVYVGVLGLLIIAYLGWNASKVIGSPKLNITSPKEETSNTVLATTIIEGDANYSSKLTINEEQIYLEENGHFKKEYTLQDGLNTFEIVAKKFLGRETRLTRKIIYQKPIEVVPAIGEVKSKLKTKNSSSTIINNSSSTINQ